MSATYNTTTTQTSPVLMLLTDPRQTAELQQLFDQLAPDVQPLWDGRQLTDAELAKVEFALAWRMPPVLLARLPALRWICATGAGVDKLVGADLPARVQVSRLVDAQQALGMAQYVAAMVLRQVRGLARYDAQQAQRQWLRQAQSAATERVLVLGRGEIGSAVGRCLQALGFEVQHWHSQAGALVTALATADVVVNTLPLTPTTTGLLDARAFAAMPRGAYLVNVARGGHVVEADLIAAVSSGHLAGAALDVQQQEPLPTDDALWSVPGITVTPHIAAQPSWRTVVEQFVRGLRCVQAGQQPPNLVDRARGY